MRKEEKGVREETEDRAGALCQRPLEGVTSDCKVDSSLSSLGSGWTGKHKACRMGLCFMR